MQNQSPIVLSLSLACSVVGGCGGSTLVGPSNDGGNGGSADARSGHGGSADANAGSSSDASAGAITP